MSDDDDDDLGRYESAAGWEPKDPYKKLRDRARKEYEMEPKPWESMLEVRPASKWITPGSQHNARSSELFGSLWREGEVAVLFGETGVGKSILAVQIAESIARGKCKNFPVAKSKPRPTLLFDFEQSDRQFTERYSVPSPIPGKLPVKCLFKFKRAAMSPFDDIPKAFKGDLDKFLLHSIVNKIGAPDPSIIIIDNISFLAKNIASDSACIRVMKTLKLWAATQGLSILVIANAKARRSCHLSLVTRHSSLTRHPSLVTQPIELTDIAGSRHIAELADSVFAIGRSTFAEDIRYIKHLKSRNTTLENHEHNVLTCQLERMEIGKWKTENDSGNSQLSILNSQLPPTPFLGFKYLGPSTEADHLRDYAREALMAEARERDELRKLRTQSSRSALAAGLIDGRYARYLKG